MSQVRSPRLRYVFFWAAVVVSSSHLSVLAYDGGRSAMADNAQLLRDRPMFWLTVLSAVTVAPWIETLVMGWLIFLAQDRKVGPGLIIFGSATIWASIHELFADGGAVNAFIPFAIVSFVFISRNEQPTSDGFLTAGLVHALSNLPGVFVLLYLNHSMATSA